MFYYLYQITNLVNNKIYVGVHKTSDINDGYMGSGKLLKSSIKKYGIDNFRKDILEYFDTSEAMYAREKEIVTDEFLIREDTYNILRGGYGGFEYINKNPNKFLTEKRLSTLMTPKDRSNRWVLKYNNDEDFKSKVNEDLKTANKKMLEKYPNGSFYGKTHSDVTKHKIKQNAIGKHDGEKNSQYGTMWINNGIENKKIKKHDIIPEGWNKGRKIKLGYD